MEASGISSPNNNEYDDNNDSNNTMKHSVHQIFQRRHEQELPSLREVSPLLDHHDVGVMIGRNSSSSNGISSSSSYQHDPEHGWFPSTKSKAKGHWKKVQRHVLQGDILLQSVVQPSPSVVVDQLRSEQEVLGSTRKDRIQRKIEEIRSGTEFRLWHGLLCIAIYLSMSVAFYNHILEPDWTMLDSMYFAIVTVTTVGYGDEYPTSNAVRIHYVMSYLSTSRCFHCFLKYFRFHNHPHHQKMGRVVSLLVFMR